MTLYSHSRLGTFESCPYKYKLRYIDRVEVEDFETVETFLGSLVHEVLEKLYKDLLNGKENNLEELLEFYEQEWERQCSPDIIVVKEGFTPENYREVGRQCLRDYYDQHHPFTDGKTVGIEERILIDLDESGRYKLQGYMDRLVDKGAGVYEIHDYKTSSRLPTQADADKDQQLALYQLAVQEMWPDVKEVRLAWHYLRFGKMIVSTRTAEQLEELRQETIEAIQTIEAATEFEPVKSVLCGWCEYKPICPLWVHLHRIEDLPPEEVATEDGVTLVDRLVQLQATGKECEEQIQQVKEAIAAYGENKGASVVFGTMHQAKITKSSGVRYPGTGDPSREELDRILKEGGKWEEVSVLNTRSLPKALEEGVFGGKLEKQIEAFGEEYETTSVRLSKRKDLEE
ncbi:PD-(D/E)XK nuclease family protein [Nitrospinae bacterium AH_259_B05_G02_I21]|nr:PD-(D/E)XK nuclease family protein [Nitrospinae bacterium AH_259_B05_G02_I21]